MKKVFIWIVVILVAAGIGAFVFYKIYLPKLVAEAIVSEEESGYMPDFVQTKIRKYRAPVNNAAEDVIVQAHKSNITIEQILRTIDNTQEDHISGLLAELSGSDIRSTNQVFDIAKKHIPADFDVEPLRGPFNEHVSLKMINDAIEKSQQQLDDEDFDPDMAKAVLKQILVQKEAEYRRKLDAH